MSRFIYVVFALVLAWASTAGAQNADLPPLSFGEPPQVNAPEQEPAPVMEIMEFEAPAQTLPLVKPTPPAAPTPPTPPAVENIPQEPAPTFFYALPTPEKKPEKKPTPAAEPAQQPTPLAAPLAAPRADESPAVSPEFAPLPGSDLVMPLTPAVQVQEPALMPGLREEALSPGPGEAAQLSAPLPEQQAMPGDGVAEHYDQELLNALEMRVLQDIPTEAAETAPALETHFSLRLGLFVDRDSALKALAGARDAGHAASLSELPLENGVVYELLVGAYARYEEAQEAAQSLADAEQSEIRILSPVIGPDTRETELNAPPTP